MNPEQGKGGNTLSKNPEHIAWIEEYNSKHPFTTAMCGSACIEGLEKFPTLRLVRGLINLRGITFSSEDLNDVDLFVDGIEGLVAPHFWLETPEGEIVDATSTQFTDPNGCYRVPKLYGYFAFPEELNTKLPTGKCPNCGDYCYNGKDLCSEECEISYVAYLNYGMYS